VARRVPPPDFRYVWLMPATGSAKAALVATTAVSGGTGALLWASGHHALAAGVILTSAALGAGSVIGSRGRSPRPRSGSRGATMAVVPWGVVVEPDTEPRVLHWPAIRKITVDVSHTISGGTPAVLASVVTVDTGREQLAGRTWGAAGLERLVANLDAYAEEAARPIALDLDGHEEAGDGATEPVMAELLSRAYDLCSSARGALLLGLPPAGYRSFAAGAAGPEARAVLRAVLAADPQGPLLADARPLAAILAAHLRARELVPDLLQLVSAPHPLVAAVAKAAAVRLGAPQSRAGAVDEVAQFLFEDDLVRIERWAAEA
jgi:hypothetical protein